MLSIVWRDFNSGAKKKDDRSSGITDYLDIYIGPRDYISAMIEMKVVLVCPDIHIDKCIPRISFEVQPRQTLCSSGPGLLAWRTPSNMVVIIGRIDEIRISCKRRLKSETPAVLKKAV